MLNRKQCEQNQIDDHCLDRADRRSIVNGFWNDNLTREADGIKECHQKDSIGQ
jgi:hypothetical protein